VVEIYGKGHEILSFFNIDYHAYIQEISDELMSHPNKRYRLSVIRVPLKKTQTAKYIQPESATTK